MSSISMMENEESTLCAVFFCCNSARQCLHQAQIVNAFSRLKKEGERWLWI